MKRRDVADDFGKRRVGDGKRYVIFYISTAPMIPFCPSLTRPQLGAPT